MRASTVPGPILVVDDNESKRFATVCVLKSAEFEVIEAATAKDGLWLAVARAPSLIVLDVNLPDLDGFEVVKRLKARPLTASIPVLHLSATRVAATDRAIGLESGADAYLTGAAEPGEFIATINALLRARRSEETAKALARQWQATFDAIYEGVCTLDGEGRILQCNGQLAILLGLEIEDLLGRPFAEVVSNALKLEPNALNLAGDQAATHQNIELMGDRRWFRCTSDPLKDERGSLVGWVRTLAESTDWHLQQEELRRAKQQAEAASQTKSLFLANMSHEIRTPLSAILGFSELLEDPTMQAEERRKFLDSIMRNGRELALIIDDILDLSKVEAGQMHLERVPCSPRSLIEDVMTSLSVRVRDKAISLSLDVAADVPKYVLIDPTRLRQIILNVAVNAVKFTLGGEVLVSMRYRRDLNQGELEVVVKDTGCGIPESGRQALFEPFSQADGSTTRQFGGTGLGLALSRRLARLLGGDLVLITSEVGRGSEFALRVIAPVCDSVEDKTDAAAKSVPRDLTGLNVLLAEDAADNRFLIKRILKSYGVEVDTALNGAEALDQASVKAYDAILMDIQMPIKDGYSATRELRSRGYQGPIIALTAHAMVEDRARCLEAGCNDQLTKPITAKRLVSALGRYASEIRP